LALAAAVAAAGPGTALAQGDDAPGETVARWVQFAPGAAGSAGFSVLVRAVVTDAASCPAATLDHTIPLPLRQRFIGAEGGAGGAPRGFVSAVAAGNFADGRSKATPRWGECEAVVPPGHDVVTVDGVDLALPKVRPRRILVMGDTGCRTEADADAPAAARACETPASFPLAYLAQFEATFRPDAIIHLGDYSHRPDGADRGGDTFDAWNADFLYPAHTLLAAAPWIMLRGNDESCGRGARGWYTLLDPFPYDATKAACTRTVTYPAPTESGASHNADFEPSYAVDLGGVNFIVHDSSFARENPADLDWAENSDIDLTAMLAALRAATPGAPAIFLSHRPTFNRSHESSGACDAGHGAPGDEDAAGADAIFAGNLSLQAVFSGIAGRMGTAFSDGVPDNVALFLSGHVHQFRSLNIGTGDAVNAQFAPQLIMGTGGSLATPDCANTQASAGTFDNDGFGFAVLDAVTNSAQAVTGYTAAIYKVSTALAGRCTIVFNPRRVSCRF
jgi:hypothetical protein